jgi:DNA-binding transcriptional MerR regulator
LTRDELATEASVPDVLIRAAESAGLMIPIDVGGEQRFSEADLEMARAGKSILELGFPLQAILERAVAHARGIEQTCDAAIDLFDDTIRKAGPAADDDHAIAEVFEKLLPQVTRLVALHFQRTLVSRALERLATTDKGNALRAALEATESQQIEVEVAWR